MSVAQPKTAESLLAEGIVFYESGSVYQALSHWRNVLKLEPQHENAARYIEFVEGHFNIDISTTPREIEEAQERTRRVLRGDSNRSASESSADKNRQAEGIKEEEIENYTSGRSPIADVSVEGSSLESSQEINEEMVTTPPVQVMAEDSRIAKRAVLGPSGPRTQADGLSIQALSRQLTDFHRAGKYESAVQTAKELLAKDSQHLVARRYIDEYHRQKQAAMQAALARQQSTPSETSSSPKSIPQPPQRPRSSNTSQRAPQYSDAPTTAPSKMASTGATLTDLTEIPKRLIRSDQIAWQEFDHRAGFFLSQVDGNTSYEDLIEISGISRDQALKILKKLVERGFIGV